MSNHRIMYRTNNELVEKSVKELGSSLPSDKIINDCDRLIRTMRFSNDPGSRNTDAVLYYVDGELVYMIHECFYRWPNYQDQDVPVKRQHNGRR